MKIEDNNNNNKQYTEKKSKKCCIPGCPVTENLTCFPPQQSEEYKTWLYVCEEFKGTITTKQHPMICALHFDKNIKKSIPEYYLTKKKIKCLQEQLASLNHFVAEWITFIRTEAPEMTIDDESVHAKAIEIAKVLHFTQFEVEFGWLNIFERYLRAKNIEVWTRNLENKIQTDEEEFDESVKNYEDALKRVKLLRSYCKRTKNKSALNIIQRLDEVLQKRISE